MATTVTVETDRQPPPKGSKRRLILEEALESAVQHNLVDMNVKINIIKRR